MAIVADSDIEARIRALYEAQGITALTGSETVLHANMLPAVDVYLVDIERIPATATQYQAIHIFECALYVVEAEGVTDETLLNAKLDAVSTYRESVPAYFWARQMLQLDGSKLVIGCRMMTGGVPTLMYYKKSKQYAGLVHRLPVVMG